jgi:hypothetical protein
MWPFGEKLAEPEPAPVDHEAVCHERMRAAKAVLDIIDAEMRAFKGNYRVRTDRHGRMLAVESPTLGGYAKIESEWRALLARRDRAVAEWHACLHAWAAVKAVKETCERKETA